MKIKENMKSILSGYAEKGHSLAVFFLFILSSAALGAIIVFPLWKFAISKPETYSIVILVSGFLALLYYIFHRMGSAQKETTKKKQRGWRNAGKFLFTLFSIYLTVLSFTSGFWIIGVILFIILFFLLGWLWFGNRDGNKYQTS